MSQWVSTFVRAASGTSGAATFGSAATTAGGGVASALSGVAFHVIGLRDLRHGCPFGEVLRIQRGRLFLRLEMLRLQRLQLGAHLLDIAFRLLEPDPLFVGRLLRCPRGRSRLEDPVRAF
jgi:hypothetical protein